MTLPRVLVLTTYYHPVIGGVETHARQLVAYLHAHGFAVQVVTKRVATEHPGRDQVDGVTVHRVGPAGERRGSGKWVALPAIFRTLVALEASYDVIVCVDYRGIGVAAVVAARWLSRPLVVQAETDGVLAAPGADTGAPAETALARAARSLPRAFYRRADHFVCIARSIERETLEAGIPPPRVHYLPHGVDLARFRPARPGEREAIRRACGWPVDRAVVLFVGRLSREKGVLDLLEAWRRLKRADAVLVFVGPDMPAHPWDAGEPGRRFVAAHGLDGSVVFSGPSNDTAPYYRAADVFAQPSHFEAFGISAIEAMASGVPVVASNVGGLRDFLSDGTNAILHEPGNPDAIAAALAEALGNPERRAHLARAALASVTDRFDERTLLARYAELIQSAARTR